MFGKPETNAEQYESDEIGEFNGSGLEENFQAEMQYLGLDDVLADTTLPWLLGMRMNNTIFEGFCTYYLGNDRRNWKRDAIILALLDEGLFRGMNKIIPQTDSQGIYRTKLPSGTSITYQYYFRDKDRTVRVQRAVCTHAAEGEDRGSQHTVELVRDDFAMPHVRKGTDVPAPANNDDLSISILGEDIANVDTAKSTVVTKTIPEPETKLYPVKQEVMRSLNILLQQVVGAKKIEKFIKKVLFAHQNGRFFTDREIALIAAERIADIRKNAVTTYFIQEENRSSDKHKMRLVCIGSQNQRGNTYNMALGVIDLKEQIFYGYLGASEDLNGILSNGVFAVFEKKRKLAGGSPELNQVLQKFVGVYPKTNAMELQFEVIDRIFDHPMRGLTL